MLVPVVVWGFVLLLGLLAGTLFVVSDRRRRWRAGHDAGAPWSGRLARTVPVTVAGPPDDVAAIACGSLQEHSRWEIASAVPWTWVGWTGISWRSWGQEVAVTVTSAGPWGFVVHCSSRPRFGCQLVDWSVSRRTASALAADVQRCSAGERALAP